MPAVLVGEAGGGIEAASAAPFEVMAACASLSDKTMPSNMSPVASSVISALVSESEAAMVEKSDAWKLASAHKYACTRLQTTWDHAQSGDIEAL